MKAVQFVYYAPKSLEEAVAILSEVASRDGRVLAGGQSLVPAMALRLAQPAHLVDINGVARLDRLVVEEGELSIGACVRHSAFHRPVVDGPLGRMLSAVVRHIAHYPIRARGTFCGSLANADLASEWCLVAATLGAKMVARSARGIRTIAADDFFRGIMTTALETDELLVEARLPVPASDTRFGFHEYSQHAGSYAMAIVLAVYRQDRGIIAEPRVGIGGVETHPRRIPQVEAMIEGYAPSAERFRAAAEAAAAAVAPIDNSPDNSSFKRDLVRAVTRRALEQCAA